ncbi:hypothetical protein F0Z19_1979 [Vibrio cyclitrophicus]|nr:hypothetical protein M565_ctg1P1318 [Vibrio cyclitrophicus FF75]KAA8600057.1 hypothetical protein F0Z19_1979 [Vibrio cyclitrophicus]
MCFKHNHDIDVVTSAKNTECGSISVSKMPRSAADFFDEVQLVVLKTD